MPDPTLNTKYGRITGREWIRRRFYEAFDEWLTPSALHYIFTRTPALDEHGRPIADPAFEDLARYRPAAAENQVISEGDTFFAGLPERDANRADFLAQQLEQSRQLVSSHVRARRRKTPPTPTIPGI